MGVRYIPNIILGNGRKFLINDGVVFLEMNYNTQKWPSLEYFITFALSIQVVSLLFSTDIHKALFNLFMWKFRLDVRPPFFISRELNFDPPSLYVDTFTK